MNLTLIGMPGSGKSFVGKKLAEELGYTLIELDPVLAKRFGKPLQEVVESMPADAFLDIEAAATIEATSGKDDAIFSPGGSIIYRPNAMAHLKQVSTIIYLEVSEKVLEERIGSIPRGIVNANGKTFAGLYAERVPLYKEWAAYTINGEQSAEAIISAILEVV